MIANKHSYNSVIYVSLPSYRYLVQRIKQSNLDNPIYNIDEGPVYTGILDITQEGFDRLEILDCVNAYAKTIQSARADLILVTTEEDVASPNDWPGPMSKPAQNVTLWNVAVVTANVGNRNPLGWMCDQSLSDNGTCLDIEKLRATAAKGFIGSHPVQYCLSKKMEPDCKIQWNTQIAIIVTVLNFIKTAVILYTAFRIKETPLMSIGDAITSFLETTDHTTVNMCLASNKDCKKIKNNFFAGPREWKSRKYYWKDAPSRTRWASFVTLSVYPPPHLIIY